MRTSGVDLASSATDSVAMARSATSCNPDRTRSRYFHRAWLSSAKNSASRSIREYTVLRPTQTAAAVTVAPSTRRAMTAARAEFTPEVCNSVQ
jgi:hypothetical protein